jgi:hypothetical protein
MMMKTYLILSPIFLFPFFPEVISESSDVSRNHSIEGKGQMTTIMTMMMMISSDE